MIFDNISPHRQTPQVMARVKAAQRAERTVYARIRRPPFFFAAAFNACYRQGAMTSAVLRRLRWPQERKDQS